MQGWLHDLTIEGIEPNPGPLLTIKDLITAVNLRINDDERLHFAEALESFENAVRRHSKAKVGCTIEHAITFLAAGDADARQALGESYDFLILILKDEILKYQAAQPYTNRSLAPLTLAPLNEEVEKVEVATVLHQITHTYEMEEKFYNTYKLLKQPESGRRYPIATVKSDSLDDVTWGSFFYNPPLLPEVLEAFRNLITQAKGGSNPQQEANLIALYQVTRFGKTKLCYSLATTHNVVVLRNAILPTDILAHIENSQTILTKLKALARTDDFEHELLGKAIVRNYHMVALWVCCYVELYQELLQNASFQSFDDLRKRDCFARICSNGLPTNYLINKFRSLVKLVDTVVEFIDYFTKIQMHAETYKFVFVFDDFLPQATKIGCHLFPHTADMDDYHKVGPVHIHKIGKAQLEEAKQQALQGERSTSLIYACVAVGEEFASAGIPVIFTSTLFRALTSVLVEERGQRSRGRLEFRRFLGTADRTLSIPLFLRKNDIASFLYYNLQLPESPEFHRTLNTALIPWEGRAGFFFDLVWPKVIGAVKQSKNSQDLFNAIIYLLQDSCLTVLEDTVLQYIQNWCNKIENASNYTKLHKTHFFRRLYFCLIMHNGFTTFSSTEEEDAVNAGLGFLVAARTQLLTVRMFAEHTVRKVFMREAHHLLAPNNLGNVDTMPPDADPIYAELLSNYGTNVGEHAEYVVMRSYMRMPKKPLYEVLECHKSGIGKDSVVNFVRFGDINTCGEAVELGVQEVDFLLNPVNGMQLKSRFGRVDIMSPLQFVDGAPEEFIRHYLPPAASQVRNLKDHITPYNFWNAKNKGALQTLDPRTFFPSNVDAAQKFFAEYDSKELFVIYIRIVVSSKGFNDKVVNDVKKYNKKWGKFQPIVLYSTRGADLGKISSVLGAGKIQKSHTLKTLWNNEDDFRIPPSKGAKGSKVPRKRQLDLAEMFFTKRPKNDENNSNTLPNTTSSSDELKTTSSSDELKEHDDLDKNNNDELGLGEPAGQNEQSELYDSGDETWEMDEN
eukprot:Phypoly_transcript_01489.p1 GENE.Phypoly_transcript_01489~~Phypoly_transcript_01489.p1  ORF type:complete len:1016 (+),score=104.32 Phypoly_transcript_01489:193-3240(+)